MILMLLLCLLTAGCVADSGAHQEQQGLPIRGGVAVDGPSAVRLLELDGDPWCSAVVVGPLLAVTAAHCVYGLTEPERLQLSEGSGPAVGIEALAVHPEFGLDARFDVAALRLGRALEPLEPVDEVLGAGAPLSLVGFGGATPEEGAGRVRQAVEVRLAEATERSLTWRDPERGACAGDSGGAALLITPQGERLVGLIVAGDADCAEEGRALRLAAVADFLADPEFPVGDDDDDPGDDDDDSAAGDDDDDSAAPLPPTACGCTHRGSRRSAPGYLAGWIVIGIGVFGLLRRWRAVAG